MISEPDLKRELAGARCVVVLGVGDEFDPNDNDGIEAARALEASPPPRTEVALVGRMPENATAWLRRVAPTHVLLLDAAQMGMKAGSVAVIEPREVRGQRFSTHSMPLSTFADYVEGALGARVLLVGIEPGADGARRAAALVAAALEERA